MNYDDYSNIFGKGALIDLLKFKLKRAEIKLSEQNKKIIKIIY